MRKYFKYLLPAFIAVTTFPIFIEQPFFGPITLYYLVGLLVAWVCIRPFFLTRSFLFVLLYTFIFALNIITGDFQFTRPVMIIMDFAGLVLSCAFLCYCYQYDDKIAMRNILFVFFVLIFYTTAVSMAIDIILPGIVRKMVRATNSGEMTGQFILFKRFGLCDYYIPHALPVLIPPVILGATNKFIKIKTRVILWLSLFCLIELTYLSGSSMALLFAVIAFFISFIIKRGSILVNFRRIGVVLLVLLPFALNADLLMDLLYKLEDFFAGGSFAPKIRQFQETLWSGSAEGTDADNRSQLYSLSFEMFLSNILIGTNEPVGGHSALLDRLGALGLAGFLPLAFFFFFQIKKTLLYIKDRSLYSHYIIGVVFAIAMMSVKSMFDWSMLMITFLILPISVSVLGADKKITREYEK